MRRPIVLALLTFGCGSLWLATSVKLAAGAPPSAEDILLRNATRVFQRAMDAPFAAIPSAVMARAQAIAVIPGAGNDGAYSAGTGVISARSGLSNDGPHWSAPAIITYDGQMMPTLDVGTIDLILVAISPRGLAYLSDDETSFTAANGIQPGPLGQDARINTNTDVLAYVQFGDYFAGITLEQWSVCTAPFANERLYGKPLNTKTVFRGGLGVPTPAQAWRNALAAHSKESS
jgi:lipid-binding SYLF domain-containing protein